jgi:plasmid stabilization system protein ParE
MSRFALIVRALAEADLSSTFRWYETQQPGLGEDFLSCVDSALASLRENPLMYPKAYKHLRRVLLRRFPYAVFYLVDEKKSSVTILAVLHCHRDIGRRFRFNPPSAR